MHIFTGTNLDKAIKLLEVCYMLWGINHKDGKFPACGVCTTAWRQTTCKAVLQKQLPALPDLRSCLPQ